MQKIILENVTVKGFDPEFVQEKISKNGKPYTKSFISVATTDEQKDQIFQALDQNAPFYNTSGENVFDKFGKIPAFNVLGEKITEVLNFEFIADVAVLVSRENGYNKTECLGIKFKEKVEGAAEIKFHKNETFDEIFTPDATDYTKPAATDELFKQKEKEELFPVDPSAPIVNDLPF